ncbi:MAG: hypothetical protein M1818_007730 [Claussenomyces sp. TS43310]|nr:MAG: hypothetical protein M1818_007730 [Claussenomyces sp. TS43310]
MPPEQPDLKSEDAPPEDPSSEKPQDAEMAARATADSDAKAAAGDKRKHNDDRASDPHKAPRRSSRSRADSAPSTKSSPLKIIQFLLSPKSEPLYTRHDAKRHDAASSSPTAQQKTATQPSAARGYFSADLTPWEQLLCAVILSRPISHTLGQRTIATILNPPYVYTTPREVRRAGPDGVHAAMEAARTQHRQKTAAEICAAADVVLDRFARGGGDDGDGDGDGTDLRGLREAVAGDDIVAGVRKLLMDNIKGVGQTSCDIFLRRVQACPGWDAVFPYIDDKTRTALEKLGLPAEAPDLVRLIEDNSENLNVEGQGDGDDDDTTKRCFILILERALGISLEGNEGEITKLI